MGISFPYAGSNPITAYAAGTVFSLTGSAAAVAFGTTSPSITLNRAGSYLIFTDATLNYVGATFAASRDVALKLRRTNNTAADVTSSEITFKTDIITALTYTFGSFRLPPVIYTTTNTSDIISLFGSVSTLPTAGSLDVVAASMVAIRLQL